MYNVFYFVLLFSQLEEKMSFVLIFLNALLNIGKY